MESRKASGDVNAPGLAAAITRAKSDSMPKDNIDRAVAKGTGGQGELLTEVLFEAFGPGGTALIITAVTDNNNRTSQEIKHIFTKAGYQLGGPGSALWAFTKNERSYTPNTIVELKDEDGEALADLIEKIEEHDDTHEVYTTADSPQTTVK